MIAMIPFVQSYLVSSFCEEVRLTRLGLMENYSVWLCVV